MGWYQRDDKRYFYRSVRQGKTVRKIYFGGGSVGEFAARAEQLRQHEKRHNVSHWKQQKQHIKEAVTAFDSLDGGCELMRDAVLLAAGFHRPARHAWRIWRDGQRFLKQHSDGDDSGPTAGTDR